MALQWEVADRLKSARRSTQRPHLGTRSDVVMAKPNLGIVRDFQCCLLYGPVACAARTEIATTAYTTLG